jgi:putative membrane protein
MKRLTFDMVLAGSLALAPLAWAQDYGSSGATQDRTEHASPRTPGELPPAEVPVAPPPSTTTGSERAGNQPSDSTRPAATNDVSDGDVAVIRKVHEANQKEIEMGQLAADKGKSTALKSYARKLVDDHKTMDRQLMSYASKKGLASRLEQTATGTEGTRADSDMHARLQGETGSEFDKDFASTMVDEHDKAIEMVRGARDTVTDSELRTMLGDALPKLEKHRKMAQDLVDKKLKS